MNITAEQLKTFCFRAGSYRERACQQDDDYKCAICQAADTIEMLTVEKDQWCTSSYKLLSQVEGLIELVEKQSDRIAELCIRESHTNE